MPFTLQVSIANDGAYYHYESGSTRMLDLIDINNGTPVIHFPENPFKTGILISGTVNFPMQPLTHAQSYSIRAICPDNVFSDDDTRL